MELSFVLSMVCFGLLPKLDFAPGLTLGFGNGLGPGLVYLNALYLVLFLATIKILN